MDTLSLTVLLIFENIYIADFGPQVWRDVAWRVPARAGLDCGARSPHDNNMALLTGGRPLGERRPDVAWDGAHQTPTTLPSTGAHSFSNLKRAIPATPT